MSTKSSLAYADEVHLYEELTDLSGAVYLNLRGEDLDFTASPSGVTVRIPLHVWHAIRQVAVPLDHAEKSDEDLLRMVEEQVDERIREYQAAEKPNVKAFLSFAGSLLFGETTDPRETQVQTGLDYFKAERKKQQEIIRRAQTIKLV